MMAKPKQTKPKVGQITEVYGHKCRIIRIHAAGTMDVEQINGPRAWRITGLGFSA